MFPRSRAEKRETHNEDELELVDKRPFDCISVFLVCVLARAALDDDVTNEGVDG